MLVISGGERVTAPRVIVGEYNAPVLSISGGESVWVTGPDSSAKNSASMISEHKLLPAPETLPQKSIGRSCCGCFSGATPYPWMIFPVARTVPVEVAPANWINIRHEVFGISGKPRPAQSAVKRALASGL